MSFEVGLLLSSLLAALIYVARRAVGPERARWETAVSEAGRHLGLTVAGSWLRGTARATGRAAGGYEVTVDSVVLGERDRDREAGALLRLERRMGTRIRVSAPVSPALDAAPDALGLAADGPARAPFALGDGAFDGAVVLHGDEDEVLARLNQPARAALLAAVRAGARLRSGSLEWVGEGLLTDPHAIVEAVQRLVFAAAMLEGGADHVTAMARNAAADPLPGVRRACLAGLIARHPERAETRDAVEAALRDEAPEVRLLAASVAGDAGTPLLLAVATDAAAGTAARVEAWHALALGRASAGGLGEALDVALDEAAASTFDGALRDAVLCASELSGHAPAPGRLAALEPLAGAEGRRAIAAIRRRLGGASSGGLSIAEPGASGGELALEAHAAGALALVAATVGAEAEPEGELEAEGVEHAE
jgi:hypothetical protein